MQNGISFLLVGTVANFVPNISKEVEPQIKLFVCNIFALKRGAWCAVKVTLSRDYFGVVEVKVQPSVWVTSTDENLR